MTQQEKNSVLQKIYKFLDTQKDGKAEIGMVGSPNINTFGVPDYKAQGFKTLRKFLTETFPQEIELTEVYFADGKPPKVLVSRKASAVAQKQSAPSAPQETPKSSAISVLPYDPNKSFFEWYEFLSGDSEKWVNAFMPERWQYKTNVQHRPQNTVSDFRAQYPILARYLESIFRKLLRDGGVIEINHRQSRKQIVKHSKYAAFCTGLCDRNYDTVYVLFSYNASGRNWHLFDFFTAGDAKYPELITEYDDLPKSADFFTGRLENLIYNPNLGYQSDTDRMLNHIDRFPGNFTKRYLDDHFLTIGGRGLDAILAKSPSDPIRIEYMTILRAKLGDPVNILLRNRITNELQYAVSNAMKKALHDRCYAVPIYDSENDVYSIAMPFSLSDDGEKADLALLVRYDGTGYRFVTLLALERAYVCARVLGKCDCGWMLKD